MNIRIEVEDLSAIDEYASVSIAFEVASVFDVNEASFDDKTPRLIERLVQHPYLKDYDQLWSDSPREWSNRFDVTHWHFFAAYVDDKRAGGAVLVIGASDVEMLEGRHDIALLWDIRVDPAFRSKGVGSALLAEAEGWAKERGATNLKVETQNINVPACRFYESRGFELRHVNAGVYEGLPNEVQLLWCKPLH